MERADRNVARTLGLFVAIAMALAGMSSAARAATSSTLIEYTCFAPDQAVCAVNPDGSGRRTLRPLSVYDHYIGTTQNGATIGYDEANGNVHLAPSTGSSSGGLFFAVNDTIDHHFDAMSPDGAAFLDSRTPGSLVSPHTVYEYLGTPPPNGTAIELDSNLPPGNVYGAWYGDTPVTVHQSDPNFGSWVCVDPVGGSCAPNSAQARINLPGIGVGAVVGSPAAGLLAVEVETPTEAEQLNLYRESTGAFVRTVLTSAPRQQLDLQSFSPDGTQIAYITRPLVGVGPKTYDIVDLSTGATHALPNLDADTLAWVDAPRSQRSSPAPTPAAPVVLVSAPTQSLATARRHHRLSARCAMRGAGTCRVQATVSAAVARRLRLTGGRGHHVASRRSPRYTLAQARTRFTGRGRRTLTLKLSGKAVRALGRTHRLSVLLTASSTRRGHRARHASRTITLR